MKENEEVGQLQRLCRHEMPVKPFFDLFGANGKAMIFILQLALQLKYCRFLIVWLKPFFLFAILPGYCKISVSWFSLTVNYRILKPLTYYE